MNILIITGSPREGSNSTKLAEEFARGAKENGHLISLINAGNAKVNPCKACNYCRSNIGSCVINDDFPIMRPQILNADVIAFASPIYYFSISAQLKCVIDRFYGLNTLKDKMFGNKKCVLLTVQGQKSPYASIPSMAMYQDILGLYQWEDLGQIHACGIAAAEAVNGTDYLRQAYELGKSIK